MTHHIIVNMTADKIDDAGYKLSINFFISNVICFHATLILTFFNLKVLTISSRPNIDPLITDDDLENIYLLTNLKLIDNNYLTLYYLKISNIL